MLSELKNELDIYSKKQRKVKIFLGIVLIPFIVMMFLPKTTFTGIFKIIFGGIIIISGIYRAYIDYQFGKTYKMISKLIPFFMMIVLFIFIILWVH